MGINLPIALTNCLLHSSSLIIFLFYHQKLLLTTTASTTSATTINPRHTESTLITSYVGHCQELVECDIQWNKGLLKGENARHVDE